MNYEKLYDSFIDLVIQQDKRNQFKINNCIIINNKIPKSYIEFIKKYNPINVEIVFKDLNALILFPYEDLDNVQKEYGIDGNYFVFGSINGDPVFFNENTVCIAKHGQGIWDFEIISNSFIDYIEHIIGNMR